MGSPLGPLFANVFMSNFEKRHRDKLKELGVNLWLRYVDDIFATLEDIDKATKVLDFLNKQHPNIKFTIEFEANNKLPFLDTTVYRGVTSFHTTIHRKKTFTGVYLNWKSLTAKRYKIGLIYCLLDRIWKICDVQSERIKEMDKLRTILAKNEYPEFVVEREINKFIKQRTESESTSETLPVDVCVEPELEPEKVTRFVVLPYVSQKAEGFAKRLKVHVNKFYPQVDFNVAFKTPNEIGKFFPFKDKVVDNKKKSGVVYQVNCKCCEAVYIGKTIHTVKKRMEQHHNDKMSAMFRHEKSTGHLMDYDNVEIIDSSDSNFRLLVKEMFHILDKKPSLNVQMNDEGNHNINTLIAANFARSVGGAGAP